MNDSPVIDKSLNLFSVSIDNPSSDAVDAMLVWARDWKHARELASQYEHIPEKDRSKWIETTCVSPCSPTVEVLLAYKTSDLPENQDDEDWSSPDDGWEATIGID